nr:chorismate synthase [Croceicoccus marinus]
MSVNSFGRVLRFTTWGESHGPALGAVVDGCPPRIALTERDIQPFMDARRPGHQPLHHPAARTGRGAHPVGRVRRADHRHAISLMIENTDQRSKDYSDIAKSYRPGHADFAYDAKYGLRDYRGGGRSSARETAARVAAGAVARKIIPGVTIRAWVSEMGGDSIDEGNFDASLIPTNPFFCPDPSAAERWAERLDYAAARDPRWARW